MLRSDDLQDKIIHKDKVIGSLEPDGQIKDVQNQEGIELIVEKFPCILNNALPEGERLDNLLRHSSIPIKSLADAAKNLDELPGNFYVNEPQYRSYTPFPDVPDSVVYIKTTLPEDMFFVNSDIRTHQKPSFSGYQDKFTAKAELINGELVVCNADSRREYGNVIIKPYNKELPGVAQNEYVCMRLARKIGLEVPKVFLLENPNNKPPIHHFCVERFDFTNIPPFEKQNVLEFAALMGLNPEKKYSIKTEYLFRCAEEYLSRADLEKLGKAYFYGILICNGDMHAKNFSVFVGKNNTYRLTPIYDMVNTHAHGFRDMLALPMTESHNPNPKIDIVIEFLEKYINKDEMCKTIKAVEEYLPEVMDQAFPQENYQEHPQVRFRGLTEGNECSRKRFSDTVLNRIDKIKNFMNLR